MSACETETKAEKAPLQPLVIKAHAYDDLSIDILGGDLPQTKRGNKYVLVICCSVSKWPFAIPLRNLRAKTIADKLTELWCAIGIPSVLRLDNMASFRSELFTAVAQEFGIDLKFSAVGHSQSHGQVKNFNKSLEQMLKKFIHDYPRNWDELLPFLLCAIRDAKHESTGYSPAKLVYGHKLRGLLEVQKIVGNTVIA